MGRHVQRKSFDSPDLAAEAAQAFGGIEPSIFGARMSIEVAQEDGVSWIYVIHEGDRVSGTEPLLPDFERFV